MRVASCSATVVALLLVFPTAVRADWVGPYTYDVSVSTSASGPFSSSAVQLWTSNVPEDTRNVPGGFTPSSIDLDPTKHPSNMISGNYHFPFLARSTVTLGNFDSDILASQAPFALKLDLHDNASGQSHSFVFTGNWTRSKGWLEPVWSGHVKQQIGNSIYEVSLPPPIEPPNGGNEIIPGNITNVVGGFDFFAEIAVADVAATPEPSALFLALPAALALGIAVRRGRLVRVHPLPRHRK